MMNHVNSTNWLEKVYSAKNVQDLEKSYDGWAEAYDQDVFHLGYTILTGVMAGMVARYIEPGSKKILDAGCGTGIVGEVMALLGYKNITGIDLSKGMLHISEKKGVYSRLLQMKLGEPLDFQDDTFAAVVSMGVFTEGHAPAASLDELLRITQPGGFIVFSTRIDVPALKKSFDEKQTALEQAGKWQQAEQSPAFQSLPLGEPEVLGQINVYRVM